jgi:hypothetical protein
MNLVLKLPTAEMRTRTRVRTRRTAQAWHEGPTVYRVHAAFAVAINAMADRLFRLIAERDGHSGACDVLPAGVDQGRALKSHVCT